MMAQKGNSREWDYEWNAADGQIPDKWLFYGNGQHSYVEKEYLEISAPVSQYYGLLIPEHNPDKYSYELEIMVVEAKNNGIRFSHGDSNTVAALQFTILYGYLNILKTSTPLTATTRTTPISYNEWHRIKVEYNREEASSVYLDDVLVITQLREDYSTLYANSARWLAQNGTFLIRALKMKKGW